MKILAVVIKPALVPLVEFEPSLERMSSIYVITDQESDLVWSGKRAWTSVMVGLCEDRHANFQPVFGVGYNIVKLLLGLSGQQDTIQTVIYARDHNQNYTDAPSYFIDLADTVERALKFGQQVRLTGGRGESG